MGKSVGDNEQVSATHKKMESALEALVSRMRRGEGGDEEHSIRLQLSGPTGGVWSIEQRAGELQLVKGEGSPNPRVEVRADAASLQPVLAGEVDAGTAFHSGGILVKGDIAYLERFVAALGMLRRAGR